MSSINERVKTTFLSEELEFTYWTSIMNLPFKKEPFKYKCTDENVYTYRYDFDLSYFS